MLYTIDTTQKTAKPADATTLGSLGLRERDDLQEWVLHTPGILGEDLLIITCEFAGFDQTAERLDVLALDKQGKLVVIELKRSALRAAAELQALRYAAYCSTMRLADIYELHRSFRRQRGRPDATVEEVAAEMRRFVAVTELEELDNRPRIILAAEEFSPELTATVLWLRSFDMDVSCVRLQAHMIGGQVVLDSSLLIPLPEAEDFLIKVRSKEANRAISQAYRPVSAEAFLEAVPAKLQDTMRQVRDYLVAQPGVREEVFKSGIGYRDGQRQWIAWLTNTQNEVRVWVPPVVEVDEGLCESRSRSGWPIIPVRDGVVSPAVQRVLQAVVGYRQAGRVE